MNKVFGIGTDIVQVARIQKMISRFGIAFAQRILAPKEYAQYEVLASHRCAPYLAKRFAGKEAVAKALGTGIAQGIQFKEIAIINTSLGQPCVVYQGQAAQHILRHHITQTLISLADEKDFAVAFVTLVQ